MFVACENKEKTFPDFDVQTVYFPHQYPIRTIILGENRTDNSIDKSKAFSIGAAVGGAIENRESREVIIKYDSTLLEGLTNVQELPKNYYTATFDKITIPAGRVSGTVRVQLNDNFFKDPNAVTATYVIPLSIDYKQTKDSVLYGTLVKGYVYPGDSVIEGTEEANPLNEDHWGYQPKAHTLFAVRYINKYHGDYFIRGRDSIISYNGNPYIDNEPKYYYADTSSRHKYISLWPNIEVRTTALDTCELTHTQNGGVNILTLAFNDNGSLEVIDTSGVIGGGNIHFYDSGEPELLRWGGRDRTTMYLNYTYANDTMEHNVIDTLVYWHNATGFETFQPTY